ncbi:SDR family oxidoreductase [candidate division KSB1 bacterium]
MYLKDKIALITGGSRGIGRAISLALAREGATVIINYLRKKSAAEEFGELLGSKGYKYKFIKGNIEDETEIDRICSEIEHEFGRIDILVSNAVFGVVKPISGQKRKFLEKTINTNAASLLTLTQKMVSMRGFKGGNIVAVTSLGGRRVLKDYSVIGTSKAALEALVRYIAVEYGYAGIRANAISPGVVETEALDNFPDKEKMIRTTIDKTPLGRLATPEDAAELAVFLCSERSRMITGELINIDGGYSIVG